MQQLDSAYETAIRQGHHIEGAPLVIAEWNFNNIYEPTVTNIPDTEDWEYGKKYFPAKSVTNSIRPKTGSIFAAFTQTSWTTSDATLGVESKRYYTTGSDPDKVFTYWICPTPSNVFLYGTTDAGEDFSTFTDQYGVDQGTLLVEYPEYVKSNKIRVIFNLGPVPMDWSIYVHTQGAPGDGYVEIENPSIDITTGRAEIWWDGSAWVESQQLEESEYSIIDKVKIEIRTVDQPEAYLQIVEIAAGREIDLTDRVEEYSVNYQMDDVDFITPVGRMCAADGEITFNNTDLKINEQVNSDFAGLLKGRCEYRTYVKYNLDDYSGDTIIMRTGTLYSNDWQQQNEYTYRVELWDILKLLQITKIPARLFENISLARIVSQILDSVGIDYYNLDSNDFDDSSLVKYFWASGDETVFDVLDRLCESYQAAIYVDEFGVIQLLTRAQIANEEDDPVWTFRGEQEGTNLPDIESLQKKYNLQANDVTIKYNKREANIDVLDVTQQSLTSKVWEGTDAIVLRAGALTRNLSSDGSYDFPTWERDVWVSATVAPNWPFKGKVNIDGEIIEYDGKGYQKWNYGVTPPTVTEVIVKSNEEKLAADRETYLSFPSTGLSVPGGIIGDPTKQNRFTGRLFVTKRDADDAGRMAAHYNYWNYGWMGMKGWTLAPGNSNFPGKYVEPGGSTYNMANVQNHKTRPGWNSVQTRWSLSESVVKCNNSNGDHNVSMLIRNVGSTECKEFGTRMRLTGDFASGGIIFYLSNASGYDDSGATLTDPINANRYYILTITATETIEKRGRNTGLNEVTVEVKNGGTLTKLQAIKGYFPDVPIGTNGIINIDKNKWYDVDIVVKNGNADGAATMIEVYVDGQWIDTWKTVDNIRPTAWMGVHARQKSVAEFESFYATSYVSNINPGSSTDENYDIQMFNYPSGTNVTKAISLAPALSYRGAQSVLSFSTTTTSATISSLKIRGGTGSTASVVKQVGPITIAPDTKITLDLDTLVANPSAVEFTYTSTNELAVGWEYNTQLNFPYETDMYIVPPDNQYYDIAKGGYLSSKLTDLAYNRPIYPVYTDGSMIVNNRFLFMDDFGATVHELRDFEVDYDVKPAKGVRVYISNNKVRLVDQTYNPEKGIFTLANASHRDEIVNGTEEISESDSIDHILMLYGYILEDKGEKTKEVKNNSSIRKYGQVAITIEADWIFTEAEAESLGNWIVEHWSDPMDTVTLDVFSNTFSQIGDKVNIVYGNSNILDTWLYIISDRSTSFDSDGLTTSVTLRRVR